MYKQDIQIQGINYVMKKSRQNIDTNNHIQ